MWPFFLDWPLHDPKLLIGFKIILQLLSPDDRLLAFECPLFRASCGTLFHTIQQPSKFWCHAHGSVDFQLLLIRHPPVGNLPSQHFAQYCDSLSKLLAIRPPGLGARQLT